jgi:hypothetical protein
MAAQRQASRTRIVASLGAGALGTLAMTGWQELSARLMSDGDGDGDGDGETGTPSWEDAPVPAQVARKLANVAGDALITRSTS